MLSPVANQRIELGVFGHFVLVSNGKNCRQLCKAASWWSADESTSLWSR